MADIPEQEQAAQAYARVKRYQRIRAGRKPWRGVPEIRQARTERKNFLRFLMGPIDLKFVGCRVALQTLRNDSSLNGAQKSHRFARLLKHFADIRTGGNDVPA